jgi:phage repressor protein C with HTH and peptisase S24 domain
MKKVIYASVAIIILAVAGVFAASRFFKVAIFQSVPVLDKISCAYPVAISGDSMVPALKPGSRVVFNQCVEQKENLVSGTVVLFKENNVARIFRIKEHVQKDGKVFYLVDQDNREDKTMEVAAENIIAIWDK